MSGGDMGVTAKKGRIFVFICLNLYVTITSGLPLKYHRDVRTVKNGGTSDGKGGESVYLVNVSNELDALDRRSDNERIILSKNIQEVNITHGLNKVGKHSGYNATSSLYHANSNNGKVKLDAQGFIAESKKQGKVREERVGREIALAQRESLTPGANEAGTSAPPTNMVLTLASVLVGLFGMSVLVAIFQCCCRKKKNDDDDSIEERVVKDDKSEENRDDTRPQSVPHGSRDSDPDHKATTEKAEKSEDAKEDREESVSFRNRIKAFEKTSTPEPSPVSKGPTPKKRPQSEAFKAFESKGILIGMGRSPLLARKAAGNEDENQNETQANISSIQEEQKTPDNQSTGDRKTAEGTESKTVPEIKVDGKDAADDDMAGYIQPENPDVVVADVDEEGSEFGVIKRETEVLRSYRKAPPPKNRNRSSAAFRRKAAKESMADLINEEKEDSPLLAKTDKNSDVSKFDFSSEKKAVKSAISNTKDSKNNSSSAGAKSKEKSPRGSPEKISQSPKRTPEPETVKVSEPVVKVTEVSSTEISAGSKEDIAKSEPELAFPPGGNIFLQIDPTVRKKSPDVPKKIPLQHGRSNPDIRVGSGNRNDVSKLSPVLPDGRLAQALTDKFKGKNGDSELKQNKLYNRRSLNTDL